MFNVSEPPNNQPPTWLRTMQNGSIGEARSRAFLLDRFWVLERSVDIDGADFIIQRRLTHRNLLDREAPRLGVVQVKFFGTPQTSHYVHRQYVVDGDGKPRSEFFLLCHSGGEEDQKAFLLTADEVQKNFTLSVQAGAEKFYLPFDQVCTNSRYDIKSRKLALDRIEHQLALAEFTTNRRFMSWVLPSASTDVEAILPEYREPLDNDWGDIPDGFTKLKQTARHALYALEEIHDLLRKVADSLDPLEAEKAIKDIAYNCRYGYGKWRITLPDGLDDEDLFNMCREHRGIVSQLRQNGLLDAFILMRTDVKREITNFLKPHFPVAANLVHVFTIYYKVDSFSLEKLESRLVEAAEFVGKIPELDSYGHIVIPSAWPEPDASRICSGQVRAFWLPGRYGYTRGNEEKSVEKFNSYDFRIYRDCMGFIYRLKYGEAA